MSYAREISRLAHSATLSLGAGRSPGKWRRELARSTARLDSLGWASAWVESLAAIELRLRDGPLLGSCIAELTAHGERAARIEDSNRLPRRVLSGEEATGRSPGSTAPRQRTQIGRSPARLPAQGRVSGRFQPAAPDLLPSRDVEGKMSAASNASPTSNRLSTPAWTTPTKPWPARSGFVLKVDSETSTAHEDLHDSLGKTAPSRPRVPVSSIAGLPGEASLTLLTRLFQGSSLLYRAEGKSKGLNEPSVNHDRTAAMLSPSRASSLSASVRDRLANAAARPIRRAVYDLIEKARQADSHTAWQAGFSKRAEGAVRRVAYRLAWSAGPADLQLGPQLSLDVSGQTAPRAVLVRLISTMDSSRPANRATGNQTAIHPAPSDAREKKANPTVAAQQERIIDQPISGNELRRRAAYSTSAHFTSARSVIEASEQEVNGSISIAGQAERVSLPADFPLLPPLTTPRSSGVEPIPVAAAIATARARAESMAADDDLDKLAAKIKLILDEQARRHGIDI